MRLRAVGAAAVVLSLVAAACGGSETGETVIFVPSMVVDTTIESPIETTIDGPWTTVPVPRTQPVRVVSDAGDSVEVQAVCLTVQVEGVLDGAQIEEELQVALGVLGLDANPDEACDADLVLSATGDRICGEYTNIGMCCTGFTIRGEVSLTVGGQMLSASPLDHDKDLFGEIFQHMCRERSHPLEFDAIRVPAAAAMNHIFGFPVFKQCPLTTEVFWRLVAALHDEDRDIFDAAATYLHDCAADWRQRGWPDEGIPFMEAVPHLLSAAEWTTPVVDALKEIAQQGWHMPRADWWAWWERQQK